MTKKEDNEVSAKQLAAKYWTEDIQRVKKILSDPNSISLEYTYKGETLKGDSSIPHGKGEKQFIEPKSFKELEEIVVDGMLIPMTYDLDFLKCLKGDVAQGFFYSYETRISEHGFYANGKLHGPSQVYFGSIPKDDALYLLICNFHEGAPDGFAFFRGVWDNNYDEMRVIKFSKGKILKIYNIEWDDDKRTEWNNFFKKYSEDLWKLINRHL